MFGVVSTPVNAAWMRFWGNDLQVTLFYGHTAIYRGGRSHDAIADNRFASATAFVVPSLLAPPVIHPFLRRMVCGACCLCGIMRGAGIYHFSVGATHNVLHLSSCREQDIGPSALEDML